jgi:PAS domain S-box-containing protein
VEDREGSGEFDRHLAGAADDQHRLQRLNWALAAYAASVSTIARSADPEDLMSLVCRSIVEQSAYLLALVCIADRQPGKSIRIVARAGPAARYADGLRLSWSENAPEGQGPGGLAIRSGAPHIVRDAKVDPSFALWRARAARHGIRSMVIVPFRKDGEVIGALGVYASQPDAFGPDELNLFERLGDQLAISISAEDSRRRLASTEEARRVAEQAIRRERDFSDAVIKSLPGVFYVFDEQMRFVRWNDNFERVTGRTAAEIETMQPADFFVGDDRIRVGAAIERVFQHGEASVEADFSTAGGSYTPHYFTGVALEIDGRKSLVGLGIDLSEGRRAEEARRESEARYRTLFDHAPDGILVADLDGVYVDANPNICRMLGYERDELIGRDASHIVVETELEQIEPALEAIRTTPAYYREWIFRRKDGSTFPAEVVATLVPYGAIMAMIRDSTERRRAQAQHQEAENTLRDLRSEIARIGRLSMLGEFAATIAHEVNQPLAAVAANSAAALRWLAASPPNLDEAREALNRITRDAHRAHELIRRTRAMVVRAEPAYAEVDLNHAIREVVLMTRSEQQRSDASVVEALLADLPAVHGNRIELQQVVLNLILNGLEAMRGIVGRERALVVRTELESPTMARVAVRDSGAGFDGAIADRLFDHFYTTKIGGTGLGLGISRSIVEAHGGRLWARPATPHGAIFQFTIPTVGGGSKL